MSRSYTYREDQIKRLLIASLCAVSFVASFIIQGSVQFIFTPNRIIAVVMTMFMVLLPPLGFGIIAPTSPAGMLLMKVRLRTTGQWVLMAAIIFVIGYSGVLQYSWWQTGESVAKASGYALTQAIIGVIGCCIMPGAFLIKLPLDHVAAELRQAHLVQRYKLQVDGETSVLRNILMKAAAISQKPLADRTPAEQQFLTEIMPYLVGGIDGTLAEMQQSVGAVANISLPRTSLLDQPEIRAALEATELYLSGGPQNQGRVEQRGGPVKNQPRPTAQLGSGRDNPGAQGPSRQTTGQQSPDQRGGGGGAGSGGKGQEGGPSRQGTPDQRGGGGGAGSSGKGQEGGPPRQAAPDHRGGGGGSDRGPSRQAAPDHRGGGGGGGGGSDRGSIARPASGGVPGKGPGGGNPAAEPSDSGSDSLDDIIASLQQRSS